MSWLSQPSTPTPPPAPAHPPATPPTPSPGPNTLRLGRLLRPLPKRPQIWDQLFFSFLLLLPVQFVGFGLVSGNSDGNGLAWTLGTASVCIILFHNVSITPCNRFDHRLCLYPRPCPCLSARPYKIVTLSSECMHSKRKL